MISTEEHLKALNEAARDCGRGCFFFAALIALLGFGLGLLVRSL